MNSNEVSELPFWKIPGEDSSDDDSVSESVDYFYTGFSREIVEIKPKENTICTFNILSVLHNTYRKKAEQERYIKCIAEGSNEVTGLRMVCNAYRVIDNVEINGLLEIIQFIIIPNVIKSHIDWLRLLMNTKCSQLSDNGNALSLGVLNLKDLRYDNSTYCGSCTRNAIRELPTHEWDCEDYWYTSE